MKQLFNPPPPPPKKKKEKKRKKEIINIGRQTTEKNKNKVLFHHQSTNLIHE